MRKEYLETIFEGYEVLSREELRDCDSLGIVLRHKKTGARVALLSNDDDNKVFYIAFRTTPKDSTGVAHIIEHTVLCGSEKYPVKDPFIALAKSSLNTFLNAMTYPDKTVYPVASCNEKDIKNLMSVYMDAVFKPNIYHYEEIFKQEGWHYELDSADAELKINGVVYNEMKGAFSSPEDVLDEHIKQSLYPDTTYNYCSGGDPEVIPELTYEDYLDFHRTYYHPSNSYIMLYGDFDMAERLEWLDKEYLSKYDYLKVDSEITLQKGYSEPKKITTEYPVTEGDDTTDKTYLSYNLVACDITDMKTSLAMDILNTALCNIAGAPVRQALLDAGIGKDIIAMNNAYIRQPYFTIIAKDTNEDREEDFVNTIENTLKDVVKDGINKDSLLAALNSATFAYTEADSGNTPRGLVYGLSMLNTWLYNDDMPFGEVKLLEIYDELKKEINTGYFEKLIEEKILNNNHKSIIVTKPVKGLTEKKDEELRAKLLAYKATLSKEEIDKLVSDTKALTAYQEEEDTEEGLATLPKLTLSDIRKEVNDYPYTLRDASGSTLVWANIATAGISYIDMHFSIEKLEKSLIPYASFLISALGSISTDKHTYLEIANETGIYTGDISSSISSYVTYDDYESYKPYISVRTKVFTENTKKALQIIEEILTSSDFDDEKRLKEVLGELISSLQMGLINGGHNTALRRAFSYFSKKAAFDQLTKGIEYYNFLNEIYNNFEAHAPALIKTLKYVRSQIITSDNILVSFTGDEEGVVAFESAFAEFKEGIALHEKELKKPEYYKVEYDCEAKNEAFKISGQVQYAATAGNFLKDGVEASGAINVLKTILAYEYLWMNVRVKGGAYGCFFNFDSVSGNCGIVSYRDPNLKDTYEVYKGAYDFIMGLELSKEEVENYIIGTMSSVDTPKLPKARGELAFAQYRQGINKEMRQKKRDEMLGASLESIKAAAKVLLSAVDSGYICTVGSAVKVEEDKALFKEIKELN